MHWELLSPVATCRLYNETKGEGIYPTPVLGMVGILDDVTKAVPADFQQVGDELFLLGDQLDLVFDDGSNSERPFFQEFGSTEYAKTVCGHLWGRPPEIDLAAEAKLIKLLTQLSAEPN